MFMAIYLWILNYLISIKGDFIRFPNFGKYKHCIEPPATCPNKHVTFHLYTRQTEDYLLDLNNPESFTNAPFILQAPIKLLIHGYTGYKDYAPNTQLRPAYFQYSNLNVISVDYKELVREPCYPQSVYNVPLVSKCTTMLLKQLFKLRKDLSFDNLHLVGFSLGAQVASQIGRQMNGTIQRITGLDPARPLFGKIFNTEVLKKSDAQFVDVVHSNMGDKGKKEPLGHLDFYANDGSTQPDCGKNASCSHVRAVDYFAESINTNNPFWAVKCISYEFYKKNRYCKSFNNSQLIIMGEHVDRNNTGIYYFITNGQSPFSRGKDPYYLSNTDVQN
ncbi:pancreatic triacylglycerol lipase-like isoform X2 [Melanaphis sacchari]|uniref:pancreatic triacylglycerol lipase-like isoform X2 n=1 Tax=Melanaphis sacchari TaxID=742174 RepID=UPI000DC1359C|nr:pancreatic triacylglycerol lipase-like isoform X2 [Melanaphis sacchari]